MSVTPVTPTLDFLPPDERLLTPGEVCQWLQVARRTLDGYVSGQLRPVKISQCPFGAGKGAGVRPRATSPIW